MSQELRLLNRQRTRSVDLRSLRKIILSLLADLPAAKNFDLTIHLVAAGEMTRLNETSLRHEGSTDVITFDYSSDQPLPLLAGEIFICMDEAILQARRFGVTWQEELARYVIHGLLHLQGYDDLKPAVRRVMKKEEGRQLRKLAHGFHLSKLQRKPRVTG